MNNNFLSVLKIIQGNKLKKLGAKLTFEKG